MIKTKEKEINNLIDYIHVIFEISNNPIINIDNNELFDTIDYINNFKIKKGKYNSRNNFSKKERDEKKIEFVNYLKKVIKFFQTFSTIEPSLRKSKLIEKENNEIEYFYRGVYNGEKFNLLPSCFRDKNYGKEDKYYHHIKSRCSNDFNGRNHLDTLVTLQHYQCPTRLLDITSNPLVALYFACKNYGCNKSQYGYVYVFATHKSKLLFKDSDKAIILSCLARFTKEELLEMYNCCIDLILDKGLYAAFDYKHLPKTINKLYHEIMTEVGFEKRILAIDLLQNYFVQPDNSNKRIDKQSGAFIISGLSKDQQEIEEKIKYNVVYKIKINNQDKILKELDILKINEATLFPELDKIAEYFTSKLQL